MLSATKKYLLILSVTALAWSCGKKEEQKPTAPPAVNVTVIEVTSTEASYFDQYPGTVVPLNEIELRPQVSGFITGVHFQDGAHVKKGQLLYTIDAQLYTANYDQSVAALKVQEANLVKAQKDADRYQELAKNDAVATQLVDNAEAALEVAKKQTEAAKANIKAVQTNVRYTKVYAPFNGIIGISLVKPGSPVSAGQTLLNTVSSDNQLAVDFNLDQKEIFKFTNFLKNKSATDSTFSLAFGSDVYGYNGKLSLLDRAVDPQTGTIRVRLIFPNPENMLRAGMTTTVRVLTNSAEKSVVVPYKALTEQLGEYFVYVVGDSSKVTQRKVVTGRALGATIIINEGLNDGEKIVVEGVQNLREGSIINTGEAPKATTAATK